MQESDAALVARVRHGDPAAFGRLVQRYMAAAYAVALATLEEPADAEDVCQDAFIVALQRIDECRRPERFGAWLLSIVRNRARDQRRRRTRRATLPLEDVTLASMENQELDLERAETERELLRAMRALTRLQREVLLLHDFEGWNHREIASRLGISEGSARVHLHNGRKALRAELAAPDKEER